jgi:hypothetical protein
VKALTPAIPRPTQRAELAVVASLIALLVALLALAPIAQPAAYHDLADQRRLLGIPHFWNVATNLPFLAIGLMGLALVRRRRPDAAAAWTAVFGGTALVALGSTYYHLAPSDATLVWDRIPIGIAFMGFLVVLLAEHTAPNRERALWPLAAFAIGAVFWWRFTGDLAPWVWVQLGPMLAVVLVLALLPARYTHRRYLAYALACYAAAKLFELGDGALHEWTGGLVSGHPLKHLAAAAGVACLYTMLKKRRALIPTVVDS